MSPRDWEVIQKVDAHRYLTTRQIEQFSFSDHATALAGARVCRRVLRRLADQRILQPLERRIGGVRAGSASYIWQVGAVGHRLLQLSSPTRRKRPHEPSALFLDHCLAVGDAHLALVAAGRIGQLTLEHVATEPTSWRRYDGLGGSREVLKPDLYAVTLDPTDTAYENRWFIEIDCGTENPKRLLEKCSRYQDYWMSGIEQATGGFPLVVWAMTTASAAERLARDIAAHNELDTALFRVTTREQLAATIAGGAV